MRLAPLKVSPHPQVDSANVSKATTDGPASSSTQDMDVVEFASVEYLTYEDSGTVSMVVARRGPCERDIELSWSNKNVNFPPSQFRDLQGTVVLKAREKTATFEIPTFTNPEFNVEQLQDIELQFAQEGVPAYLGDLRRTRVVTLNTQRFPHSVEDQENIVAMLKGFLLHNYNLNKDKANKGLQWRLAPGCTFIANLFITQYLIKTVSAAYLYGTRFDGEIPSKYYVNIVLLGVLYFLSFLVNMFCDLEFMKLKLGGKATRDLRVALMDTVIQLTPVGEEEYDVGRVMKIADVQAEDAVGTAYMTWFSLYANLVKLVLMIAFIMYTSISQFLLSNDAALLILITIPFIMIALDSILLAATIRKAADKNSVAMEADDGWSSFMVQASFMRQVITSFRKGFMVTSWFQQVHMEFNSKAFQAAMFSKRTQWAANTIPTATASFVMIAVGVLVAGGSMTVPVFVVFVSSINSFGPTLGAVFSDLFTIGKGFASIKKISFLLNQPTRRKLLLAGQKRRKPLVEVYRKNLLETTGKTYDPEAPELLMSNVEYRFQGQAHANLTPLNFHLKAGQIVALKGSGSVGKKMVLRLLARHFIPTEGFCSYPTRWRQRFLDATPALFGGDFNRLRMAQARGKELEELEIFIGTLEHNLKFGAQFKHPEGTPPHVWDYEIFALLKQIGVSEGLRGATPEEFSKGIPHSDPAKRVLPKKLTIIGLNGEKLSTTDRALVTIARALLSSVDLLLMCNVLDLLGPKQSQRVIDTLRELAQERCLACLATEAASTPDKNLRKQKLIIFSTKLKELEDMADVQLDIGQQVVPFSKQLKPADASAGESATGESRPSEQKEESDVNEGHMVTSISEEQEPSTTADLEA